MIFKIKEDISKRPNNEIVKKIISQNEEFAMKNLLREKPQILDRMNSSIVNRNNFLQSQKIINIRNEADKLRSMYEKRLIPNFRYLPTSQNADYYSEGNRLAQLEKIEADELGKMMTRDTQNIFKRYYY